jgi:uncharacterized tellurite resistance protein B-like protein
MDMSIEDRIQVCKVVAQAILADAQITDAERRLLEDLMERYGLDAAQKKDVLARNLGDDPAAMAATIEGVTSLNELLVELALAVAVDGVLADQERRLLLQVAKVLDVTEPELDLMVKAALA